MSTPISDATFAQVHQMQANLGIVMMASMEAAMEGMGRAMGDVMQGVGEAIGAALGGEPADREAARSTPPAPPMWAERIAKVRAGMKEDADAMNAMRAVMTEADGARVLALPAKHIPDLPTPAAPMTDAQIVTLIEAGERGHEGMKALMAEFMEIGGEIRGRIQG